MMELNLTRLDYLQVQTMFYGFLGYRTLHSVLDINLSELK